MKTFFSVLVTALRAIASVALAADAKPTPPDFTKGDKPGEAHDWPLGPLRRTR